jgi:uncharacterized cupin superfamily protein
MNKMVKKSFNDPDEMRPIPNGKVEYIRLGDVPVIRDTFQPGWRWSESIKPIAKTDSCQVYHLLYVLSGRMATRMDDGSTSELGPGDIGVIPPGHDGWVVGDVPCVVLDFGGSGTYAKPS